VGKHIDRLIEYIQGMEFTPEEADILEREIRVRIRYGKVDCDYTTV
jgi:hypothetical protein